MRTGATTRAPPTPTRRPTRATAAASGRPETEKGAEWDAAFYQTCVSQGAEAAGVSSRAAAGFCHCIGGALQPLPLSRKKRLVAHSHEILAAESQCTH